jgi:hypothetical protein
MLDPLKPSILFLDPDHDFLELMEQTGKKKGLSVITLPYSKRDTVSIEEILFQHYPDVVVINLDQSIALAPVQCTHPLRWLATPATPST